MTPPFIDYITQALSFILVLFFIFMIGIFAYKFSVSIDKGIIKSFGDFLYRIMCKSGFMVLIIVIITYIICKNESNSHYQKTNNAGEVVGQLAKNNGVIK